MYDHIRSTLLNSIRKDEKKRSDGNLLFTRETFGVVLVLFSTLCLICLITRETIFAGLGQVVNAFLFGCFGIFAYAVIIYLIGLGVVMIAGKPFKMSAKNKALVTFGFLFLSIILQIITVPKLDLTFAEYIKHCYAMGEGGIKTASMSGVVAGAMAYGVTSLLTEVGSYVVLGLLDLVIGYFLIKSLMNMPISKNKGEKFRSSFVKQDKEDLGIEVVGEKEYPVEGVEFATISGKQKLFINNPEEFALKSKRELQKEESNPNGIKITFSKNGLGVVTNVNTPPQQAPVYNDDYKKKLDYIKTPTSIDMSKYNFANDSKQGAGTTVSDYVNPRTSESEQTSENFDIPMIEHDNKNISVPKDVDSAETRARLFGEKYFNIAETESQEVENQENYSNYNEPFEQTFTPVEEEIEQEIEQEFSFEEEKIEDIPMIQEEPAFRRGMDRLELFKEENKEQEEVKEEQDVEPIESNITSNRRIREIFDIGEVEQASTQQESASQEPVAYTSRVEADNNLSSRRRFMFDEVKEERQEEVKEAPKKVIPINREYFRPPFDLLETYTQPINAAQENHEERKEIIKRTLEEFHINAIPQGHVQGPSVTRYEIMMPAGISVKKVLGYDDDLKMRLASKQGIRIEAPIPGKNLVGIEVANNVKTTVGLKEVMEGLADKKSKPGSLMFALGKDIVGNSISDDLTKGPHYLVAGATGSGKSVCLHVMIVSLLMRYSPEELKLVLVDPKSVEFRKYEHIPHLLVDEIITEPKRALTLLQWAYDETNKRNEMFTACGGHISNIDDYNQYIANETTPKLPRIVFVIDELADLMEACKKDLEARIRMIAAKSRSAGIHLVLATQRPSVDVITGTIKANLPSRIALKVMNFADSSTILGEGGAEKLLGNGDMLYKNSSMGDYERYQGAYISGREIANIVEYIKEKNTAYFDEEVKDFLDKETRPKQEESTSSAGVKQADQNQLDELFLDALWTGVNAKTISIASLQRRFRIGYARAGGLIDDMEKMGFITPFEGAKARSVLLTREEYIAKFGPREDVF